MVARWARGMALWGALLAACGGRGGLSPRPGVAPAAHAPAQPATPDPLFERPCLWGCPVAPQPEERVARSLYVLGNNPETRFADWVAYEVRAERFGRSPRRHWKADPALPAESTLEPADYGGAHAALGTDRGHQAPLATFAGDADCPTTNYLSNITPQRSALNRGPWMRLEARVRDAARDEGVLFVLTGPLYERSMPALPRADEPHRVPSGYWKIVLAPDGRAALFLMDQESPAAFDECRADVSLVELERRSGLDLLPALATPGWLREGALRAALGCEPLDP